MTNTPSNCRIKTGSSTTTPTTTPSRQTYQPSTISCSQPMDNLSNTKTTRNAKNLFWYRKTNPNRWTLMAITSSFSAIRPFRQNLSPKLYAIQKQMFYLEGSFPCIWFCLEINFALNLIRTASTLLKTSNRMPLMNSKGWAWSKIGWLGSSGRIIRPRLLTTCLSKPKLWWHLPWENPALQLISWSWISTGSVPPLSHHLKIV